MAIQAEDWRTIRAYVEAQSNRDSRPQNGLLRPAQVQAYNYTSDIATVVFDGDTNALDIQNMTGRFLAPGVRVMVVFQQPAGAYAAWVIGDVPAVGAAIAGNVTIAHNTPVTPVTGLTVYFDTHNMFNTSTGTFTIPEGLTGLWSFKLASNMGVIATRYHCSWTTGGFTWMDSAGGIDLGTGVESSAMAAMTLLTNEGTVWTPIQWQKNAGGTAQSLGFNIHVWLIQSAPPFA